MSQDEILRQELIAKNPSLKLIDSALNEVADTVKSRYDELKGEITELKKANGRLKMTQDTPNTIEQQLRKGLLENTDNLEKLREKSIKSFSFDTKAVADMGTGTHLSGGSASLNSSPIGPVGMTYGFNNVRDLLIPSTMTGANLPVLRDNGGEGTFETVAQLATKPLMDLDLVEASSPAQVIAAVLVVSRQFLDDVPNAQSWILDRMLEKYNSVENNLLLNGDGVSPNLSGINLAGNFTAATSLAAVNDVEQLINAILQLRIQGRKASGIVINPASLGALMLNKASTSGEYDLPSYVSVSNSGQITFMGVPVVDVAEQPSGTYTVIDNRGSRYVVRQPLSVEFFEQDSTNIRENKISIRVESRIAFPIFGATYAVKGTF